MLTGVPFFDKYYKNGYNLGSHVVYIDHPYFEESLLNWNSSHHQMIAEALISFAEKRGVELFIKLHPRSDKQVWHRYINDHAHVRIIQTGDYTDLFLQARLIMGYSSSLINGFLCARKNVVLLGWHPEPRIFGSDFSKYGLCHVSFSPQDLEKKFDLFLQFVDGGFHRRISYRRRDLRHQ